MFWIKSANFLVSVLHNAYKEKMFTIKQKMGAKYPKSLVHYEYTWFKM